MDTQRPLELIKGGAQLDALCHELLMEAISPNMNEQRVAEIESAIAPRGKFSVVRPELPTVD